MEAKHLCLMLAIPSSGQLWSLVEGYALGRLLDYEQTLSLRLSLTKQGTECDFLILFGKAHLDA